jgi:hypothetical protein
MAALATLIDAARECKAAATSFSGEHAAQVLAVADELRAVFLPRPASASSAQAAAQLLQLPAELVSDILSHLDTPDMSCLAATCRLLWLDAPTAPSPPLPPRDIGLVEAELRRRAKARGLNTASSLPGGALSWVPYLLKVDRRDAVRRHVPLAVGETHSLFVDKEAVYARVVMMMVMATRSC